MNENFYEILMFFLKLSSLSGVYFFVFLMAYKMMKNEIKNLEIHVDFIEKEHVSLNMKYYQMQHELKQIRKMIE